MHSPAASAASSSTANSHASSSAPRTAAPPHRAIHPAKSRALPATHTRYTIGNNHMGRRCV
eukprot:77298-Lingulodinium_polyedra.AAC.1